MFWTKCKHPAESLGVLKEHTTANIDEDFDQVTYHLFCVRCNSPVDIKHAKWIAGVDAFLARGRK